MPIEVVMEFVARARGTSASSGVALAGAWSPWCWCVMLAHGAGAWCWWVEMHGTFCIERCQALIIVGSNINALELL
jgi:hypothetical protein